MVAIVCRTIPWAISVGRAPVIALAPCQRCGVASAPTQWPELPAAVFQFTRSHQPKLSRLARPGLGSASCTWCPAQELLPFNSQRLRCVPGHPGFVSEIYRQHRSRQVGSAKPETLAAAPGTAVPACCRFSAPPSAPTGDRRPLEIRVTAGKPRLPPSAPSGPTPASRGSRPGSWRLLSPTSPR